MLPQNNVNVLRKRAERIVASFSDFLCDIFVEGEADAHFKWGVLALHDNHLLKRIIEQNNLKVNRMFCSIG